MIKTSIISITLLMGLSTSPALHTSFAILEPVNKIDFNKTEQNKEKVCKTESIAINPTFDIANKVKKELVNSKCSNKNEK
nr:hypothetical protein [Mammaliicoccus sp. Marseille-Q6498]